MPPKDEKIFGFTGIYLNGEEITESNTFEFSAGGTLAIDKKYEYHFEGVIDFNGDLSELLRPRLAYDMVCTEIDGLVYTFTDGKGRIVIEYKYLTDEIRKIQVGCPYRIIPII